VPIRLDPPPPGACHDLRARPVRRHAIQPATTSASPVVALGATALVVVAVVIAALVVRGGLSEQSAQRKCRTAMEREAKNRASDGLIRSFVFAVQSVDIEETWATDNGYAVNGVVRCRITAALMPPTEASLSLTCEATDDGDQRVADTATAPPDRPSD
jgi:hypothetical protein